MNYNFTKTMLSEEGHKIEIDEAAMYGYWEYPDGAEGGGLWFARTDTGQVELSDYDGVFELHPGIQIALHEAGYVVEDYAE